MSDPSIPHRRLKGEVYIGPADQPPRRVRLALAQVPRNTSVPPHAWNIHDDMEEYELSDLPEGIMLQHKISVGDARISLGRVGFCIYCGSPTFRSDTDQICTSEHIIPQGLGGNLVIDEASCHKCAKSINIYEGNLLRTLFNVPRRSMSIRGRRRPLQPITISSIVDGKELVTELPIGMHPSVLVMPSYYLPQYMSPPKPETFQGVHKIWSYKINRNGFSGGSGLSNYMTPEIDFLKFGQLITKIAHSYSMSFLTIEALTLKREIVVNGKISPLPPFITSEFSHSVYPIDFYDYVGGFSERYKATENLHEIGHGHMTANGFLFDVVFIWLFANLGAPIYMVIVDASLL